MKDPVLQEFAGTMSRKRCSGTIQIEKRDTYGHPFELLTVHFADGGSAITVADILARLGIQSRTGDTLAISLTVTSPPKRTRPKRRTRPGK
jgi:hypothetical protein